MKEYVKYRTFTSTRKKYTDILRADGSPGTHFMHMRVKGVGKDEDGPREVGRD